MIFLTREGDIPVAVRALKAGAANVIPKPESGSGAFNCSIIFILN